MEKAKKNRDVTVPADTASDSAGPVKVIRLNDVSASVFRRDFNVKGQPVTYFSVSFSRSYKDARGAWKYSKNFDSEDLGRVMAIAKHASEFIDSERGLVLANAED